MPLPARAATACLLLLTASLGLPGCWDMTDIEQRAFVDAVGVDLEKQTERPAGSPLETVEPEDVGLSTEKRIVFTAEIPVVSRLAGGAGGGGGGGGGADGKEKPAWVISASGSTLFEANRELATITNRRLFYGHLKTIVIGEEAARAGVQPLIDFFERGREPMQATKVAVSVGPAGKALRINPKLERLSGTYINTLLQQETRTVRMLETDLGRFLGELHSRHNSVLPRIVPGEDQVKAAGTAVFKRYRLTGWLGEVETSGLAFLLKRVKGGVIMVAGGPGDKAAGAGITGYEIGNVTTAITPRLEGGRPVFRVRIETEGSVAEETGMRLVMSPAAIRGIEQKVAAEIKREVRGTLNKLQKEFKADVVGFGDLVHKNFPRQWAKWKNTWDDEHFPYASVDIEVVAKVRRVGTTQ